MNTDDTRTPEVFRSVYSRHSGPTSKNLRTGTLRRRFPKGGAYLSKKIPCRSRMVPVASQSWLMLLFSSAMAASSRLLAS